MVQREEKQERNENHMKCLFRLAGAIFDYTQTNIEVLSM